MNRKVLAIALSLALLSSLFVFVTPAVAGNDKMADEAGFINFEIKLGG